MTTLTVYSAARDGLDPDFKAQAAALGTRLGQSGYHAIFGASSTGLMGAFAKGFLDGGGKGRLKGYVPEKFLKKNNPGALDFEYVVTKSLSERKDLLMQGSDGFIVLPGGTGTLDEVFGSIEEDYTTEAKEGAYGHHVRPVFLLNYKGYYDGLLKQIQDAIAMGFIVESSLSCLHITETAQDLTAQLQEMFGL